MCVFAVSVVCMTQHTCGGQKTTLWVNSIFQFFLGSCQASVTGRQPSTFTLWLAQPELELTNS